MKRGDFPTLTRAGFVLPTIKASYEAAGTGRRSAGWATTSTGPNVTALPNLTALRARARYGARNDPYAAGALDKLVSNTIGTGITPKPQHPNATLRAVMQDLWSDWCDEADADGVLEFYGLQALMTRAVYEAGECFARLRSRRASDGLSVPLQVQILEADFVPLGLNTKTPAGNRIRAGIEFNAIGQRVAYWLHPEHPGETPQGGLSLAKLTRVPAENILHIYEPLRPGQLRGIPQAAPVLLRLRALDQFDDATLFRQQVANLFAGFIKRPAPDGTDPLTGKTPDYDASHTPIAALEPGTMQELLPGEDVEFANPPGAGGEYPNFMRQQLLAVATGYGLPYEVLTGDLVGVSDRAIRVVLNEFRRRIQQRQWAVFVHQFCRPIRNRWLDLAVLSGAINIPDYAQNARVYRRTKWAPQGWAYIHPVQDVQAKKLEVRAGFRSRSDVVLEQGYDAEGIDAEQAADNQRADSLGLRYDSDPRHDKGASNA